MKIENKNRKCFLKPNARFLHGNQLQIYYLLELDSFQNTFRQETGVTSVMKPLRRDGTYSILVTTFVLLWVFLVYRYWYKTTSWISMHDLNGCKRNSALYLQGIVNWQRQFGKEFGIKEIKLGLENLHQVPSNSSFSRLRI